MNWISNDKVNDCNCGKVSVKSVNLYYGKFQASDITMEIPSCAITAIKDHQDAANLPFYVC